jgi:hypothetical protein
MDKKGSKILVVTKDVLSPKLAEYALTVAQRLDMEIVVLFVDPHTSWSSNKERNEAVKRFESVVKGDAAKFSALAWELDINVITIVDVDSMESAVNTVCEQEPDIRFIISDDADQGTGNDKHTEPHPTLTVVRP